jgi:glycosyltransferase involved in cell wall biosynthesis
VLHTTFLSASEMGEVFSQTLLNVHPCRYDAYGMTVAEAAAWGAPSLVAAGGNVGVAELLTPDEGLVLQLDFTQPMAELASAVEQLLCSERERLEKVSVAARERVLAYTEEQAAAGVGEAMESAVREHARRAIP